MSGGPKEQRVPLIDPGEPPPPPPDLVPSDDDADADVAEEATEPTRPSSGRRLPVDIGNGRTLDGEIIDQAKVSTSSHAFRFSGFNLLDF